MSQKKSKKKINISKKETTKEVENIKKTDERKKEEKKKNIPIIGIILSIIVLFITILLLINILKLNIIPTKYLLLFIVLEIFLIGIIILLLTRKKKLLWILGIFIFTIISIFNLFLNSYIETTNIVINKLFTDEIKVTTDYLIITNINNPINQLEEVGKDQTIYFDKYIKNKNEVLKEMNNYSLIDTDTISNTLDFIKNNPVNYLLLTKADYSYIMNSSILFSPNNYKIIKEFSITIKEKRNKEVKKTFNIYLNGVDFTGVMRDFNMIITVNTETKKVLLTPILRGFYIDVPSYNIKDTLMCLGAFDSEVSKEAIEKLLDTTIDYTVSVNTNSLVSIVDSLGGIEFCSDYTFTTTHALVEDTYNDNGKEKLTVNTGCRNYNGIEILAIARERVRLKNNERGRIENCKKIMLEIAKKMVSTTSLLNHKEVLTTYSSLYTTDMNKELVQILFKSVLEDYNSYKIEEQHLDGIDTVAIGHLGTQEVGATIPDENQVNEARRRIKEILKKDSK